MAVLSRFRFRSLHSSCRSDANCEHREGVRLNPGSRPLPIKFSETDKIYLTAKVEITEDLPLDALSHLKLTKLVEVEPNKTMDVDIPCVDDMGSCDLKVCDIFSKWYNDVVCPFFKRDSIPCECPIRSHIFQAKDVYIQVPFDKIKGLIAYLASTSYLMTMFYIRIVSNIILIACLHVDHSLAADYFKYDARQPRGHPQSGQISGHEKRSANVYDLRCPKQEYIHPCDCLELDKRLDAEFEGSGGGDEESGTTGAPAVGLTIEEAIHPDLIETVAFCKNIRNVQVLTDAIKGFHGHRINYFVLDGCKLPPFPNSLFNGVNILWMEILNSTLQFHENYFNSKACP
ncbi:unnamed protein product [Oppiella nova]|uniref:Uncharacterized protein n=1 Tax=Oppiella nova TaxID=334625 RepID=A0A7R9QJN2_9ACAR|nr:unnamed protein product [Oppiella nova]CAG2166336.1 unnamed protein product [Oppiella nova]